MALLYCPKCGSRLTRNSRGALYCAEGGMELSGALERGLTECFVDRSRESRHTSLNFTVGGHWFCPACGVAATESTPGYVRCPSCGCGLSEFLHQLIEFHRHLEKGD